MRFLPECFSSLMQTTYRPVEWIFVDNASTDESIAYMQNHFPEVVIIRNAENTGYARGNNLGIRASHGQYLVLLNNDTRVEPGWLTPLVEAAEHDSALAALQPKLKSMTEPEKFEYAGACGGMIDRYGYPFLRGRIFNVIESDHGQYDDPCDIFWATGAALFLRKSALEKTGFLDEDFVYHMEEIDLCWRLLLAGYRIRCVPQSVVYHYGGGTLPTGSYRKLYLNHRNNLYMLFKNLGFPAVLTRLSVRFVLDMVNFLMALLKFNLSWCRAILSAHAAFWFHLPQLRHKRRSVQCRRQVPDAVVFRSVYPRSIVVDYFIRKKRHYSDLFSKSIKTPH